MPICKPILAQQGLKIKTIALKRRHCGSICCKSILQIGIFVTLLAQPIQLHSAILLRRYKRFLADIRLADGSEITVHCPNTGSMKNCVVPETECWFSLSDSKTRKYPQTLELVTTPSGDLAGINTGRANKLVAQAIEQQVIEELQGYGSIRAEVPYGQERSRIDFLLQNHSQAAPDCYLEVKNLTLMEQSGQGFFPDAVSERGSKHLRELIQMRQLGFRAVLCFCVQHTGIAQVSPAAHIDTVYAETLAQAVLAGVEVIAYGAEINPHAGVLSLAYKLPFSLK
jgi:sugar fermentation stimulation protein A